MPESPAENNAVLEARYGAGKRRGIDKRLGWALGGAAVLVGLAVVLFGGWHVTSDMEFKDLGYDVIDDRTVAVDVQVTAPLSDSIICAVEALSPSYGTVGWKLIEIPPGDERTRRFQTTIVTTNAATTGTVRECWATTP